MPLREAIFIIIADESGLEAALEGARASMPDFDLTFARAPGQPSADLPADLAIVDAGLAEAFIALSRIPEAHRHAQRSLDVFITLGKRLHSTLAILPLAQALFHEGDLDEALRYINEAIEIEQTSDEPDIEEIVRYEAILKEIVIGLGQPEVAAEIVRRHESIREISDL